MNFQEIGQFFVNMGKYLIKLLLKLKVFFQEWIDLVYDIAHRFLIGFKSVNFVIYFVFVIVVIGGLGVFPIFYEYTKFKSTDNEIKLAKVLSTYFITLIATCSADLMINREPSETEASKLRMPAFAVLVFGGVSIFLIQYNLIPEITYRLSIVSLTIALLFWWITNSQDKKYSNGNGLPNTTTIGGKISPSSTSSQEKFTKEDLEVLNKKLKKQNLPDVNF